MSPELAVDWGSHVKNRASVTLLAHQRRPLFVAKNITCFIRDRAAVYVAAAELVILDTRRRLSVVVGVTGRPSVTGGGAQANIGTVAATPRHGFLREGLLATRDPTENAAYIAADVDVSEVTVTPMPR